VTSEHSRRAYRAGLAALAAPDPGAGLTALLAAGSAGAHAAMVRFRAALLERGLAPATINLRLAAVKSAVRLARLAGTIVWELHVPAVPAAPRRETRGPAPADIRRLGEAAGRQDTAEKATRDVALIRLLFDLGLRRGEVVAIDVADLAGFPGARYDSQGPSLGVRRKGGARVRLELPEETAAAVAAWLAPGGDRERLTGAGVYYVVRTLGWRVGMRCWPHGLRHASITAALRGAADRGIPLPEVLPATGHAPGSVRIVLEYFDHDHSRQGELARLVAGVLALPRSNLPLGRLSAV
jgi:integrase/recombinase XerC